jgi:hypothetical protein
MSTVLLEPLLKNVAGAYFVLAMVTVAWCFVPAAPVMGIHPAIKPTKFALSIAVFLGTLAYLVPRLTLGPTERVLVVWTLVVTMGLEMVPILLQPARGTLSHFNLGTPIDRALWRLMMVAIVVATGVMGYLALVAWSRPLWSAAGEPMAAMEKLAWQLGLSFFPLVAVSGFAMGGRLKHSVGGADGGPGLPFVNWSVTHGDLRVSHFFALHALQLLPLAALGLSHLAIGEAFRWGLFAVVVAFQLVVAVATLAQAFLGRPFWAG